MTTSPCTTCIDTTRRCPCHAYAGWLLATDPGAATPEPSGCATCADAEWLTPAGEAFEQVAARLNLLPKSLESHLRRHQRADLLPRRTT